MEGCDGSAALPRADGSFCNNQRAKRWIMQTLMSSTQTFSQPVTHSCLASESHINPLLQVKQQPSGREATVVISADKWKGPRTEAHSSPAEYSAFTLNKEVVLDQLCSLFIPAGFSSNLQVISRDTSASAEFALCHMASDSLSINETKKQQKKTSPKNLLRQHLRK